MSTNGQICALASRFDPVRLLRRGPWEAAATAIIAAGVVMLMQPFSITLYGWSFAMTLAGIVTFAIGSKLPE
jgi:hypothetical protein